MASTTTKSAFWRGFRDGAPFGLVVGPFAILFGVVATEAGLAVLETLAFSVIVIAGAAQMTAIQLMTDEVPTLIVLASALAVNLRMAMYSASLTPHLGGAPLWQRALIAYFTVDQSYACSISEYERKPDMTMREKVAYFLGSIAPVAPVWYIATLIGALIGTAIPDTLALDFAVPITFIALVAPMLKTPAHIAAAVVAVILSLLLHDLPYGLGLLVAGLGGMMAGARVEVLTEAQRPREDASA